MGFLGLAATCVLLVPRESFKFRSSWRGSASVAFARLLVFPGFIVLSKEWAKDENISLKTPKKKIIIYNHQASLLLLKENKVRTPPKKYKTESPCPINEKTPQPGVA